MDQKQSIGRRCKLGLLVSHDDPKEQKNQQRTSEVNEVNDGQERGGDLKRTYELKKWKH